MLIDFKKVTQEQMLVVWAVAEASSIRRWKYLKDALPKETSDKLIKKEYDSLSPEDFNNLINIIKQARAPLLDGLLKINPKWYLGKLSIKDYKNILIIN